MKQPAVSLLTRVHDFETGSTVFVRYVDDALIGMAEARGGYYTAESVERYKAKLDAKGKSK